MNNQHPSFLLIDLFCGAGGTTTGAIQSGHAKVIAAINHDPIAIKSHSANHHVHHFIEDIRSFNADLLLPIVRYWKGKYPKAELVIWASLECTNFSKAKGGLPRDADSRTLADHLPRYIQALNPDKVLIENVVEFLSWGPLDDKGRPLSMKNGRDYLAWVKVITQMGFKWDYRLMNSADYGAYTSRVRLFGAFYKGEVMTFPEPTHSRKPQQGPMFIQDQLKPWKPVAEVLDFSDIGKSIFNRKKPLVDNTLKRILKGLKKHVGKPMLMTCNNPGFCSGLENPSSTITTAGHKALVVPFCQSYYGNGQTYSLNRPASTLTTKDRISLIIPFISRQFGNATDSSIEQPAGSLLASPKMDLVCAFIVNPQYNNSGASLTNPCPTVIATQRSRPLGLSVAKFGDYSVIEIAEGDSVAMQDLKRFCQNNGIEDVYLRMLKVDELKRIQGFPDNYILLGTQNDQKKFIGNSVVPVVVKSWFKAMHLAKYQPHFAVA